MKSETAFSETFSPLQNTR